jgi:hypothetical protein
VPWKYQDYPVHRNRVGSRSGFIPSRGIADINLDSILRGLLRIQIGQNDADPRRPGSATRLIIFNSCLRGKYFVGTGTALPVVESSVLNPESVGSVTFLASQTGSYLLFTTIIQPVLF